MKTSILSTIAVASLALAAVAQAHGPIVQLTVENNQIVTRGLVADTANYNDANALQRVYTIPLAQRSVGDTNDGWYAQPNDAHAALGPGIGYGNGGFAAGSTITETLVDGLKFWDGSGFVDAGTEEVQGLRGSIATPTVTLQTNDAGLGGSFSITPTSITATSHGQAYWRLLGDGVTPTAASDDGVYLLTLQVSTTQAGVTASDPFYFLLTKNASSTDIAGAQAFAAANLPEPASLAVAATGVCGMLARRRRQA